MMEALGAIAAEPGEVPDCNCSFFFILFYFIFLSFFFTHINTSHPHHKRVAVCAQSSVCREELFCWVECLTSMSNFSMQQLPKAHWVIVAFEHQTLPGLKSLVLCHPLGLFLLPSSNQALFYCILCQCVNDFVRIPQPCPACRVLERTRAGGWQTLVGFFLGKIEDSSWREQQFCLSCLCIPWGPRCRIPLWRSMGSSLEDLHTSLLQGACDNCVSSGWLFAVAAAESREPCPGCAWRSRRGAER